MRIEINLASQPFQDAQRFVRQWALTLGLVGLLTIVLAAGALVRLRAWRVEHRRINELQSQIDQGNHEISQAEAFLNRPENRDTRDKSQILNELIVRKAFSWTRVFENLEQVMPAHLHVISIHPGVSSGNTIDIKLVVGGESPEQALALVRKMENSNHFKETRIASERFVTDEGANRDKVQFEIEAAYLPSVDGNETSGGMH